MSDAKPKSWQKRRAVYRKQNGSASVGGPAMTPAQSRRDRHKRNARKSS